MLNNIKHNDLDLARIVAKSLQKLSYSSKNNFMVEDQKNKIMQGIFDLLGSQDHEIVKNSLEALITVCE